MKARGLVARVAFVLGLVAAVAGCNSGTGDCPAEANVQPGASCSDDNVQCAYSLATPSPACDGTTTTIASSCVCTNKTWSCPSPVDCGDASTADASDGDASTDSGPRADTGAPDSRAIEDTGRESDAREDGSVDAAHGG